MVHGDIKPENILLKKKLKNCDEESRWQVRISDFGLANSRSINQMMQMNIQGQKQRDDWKTESYHTNEVTKKKLNFLNNFKMLSVFINNFRRKTTETTEFNLFNTILTP